MEQDFKRRASKVFDTKREEFYVSIAEDDINSFMYVLGVDLGSSHHQYKVYEIVTQYAPIFKPLWDLEIWEKATWGADNVERDIEEQTMLIDNTLKEVPYYDLVVRNAAKYNRPDWAIFGLIGKMQGTLNQNASEVSTGYIWKTDDLIRCLRYLKTEFLFRHRDSLEYLFAYFDERNYRLTISDSEPITINIIENSKSVK